MKGHGEMGYDDYIHYLYCSDSITGVASVTNCTHTHTHTHFLSQNLYCTHCALLTF